MTQVNLLPREVRTRRRVRRVTAAAVGAVAAVDVLLHQQVLWSQVLQDMSATMPDGAFLTSLTGSLQGATDASGTAGATGAVVANLSLQGTALDYPDLTALLRRLERVDGWVNPWVSQATRAILDGQRVVQFTATVDLSPDATVNGRAK